MVKETISQLKVYTTGMIAAICSVAPRTVTKWIDKKLLKGWLVPGTKVRRVERVELDRFIDKYGMTTAKYVLELDDLRRIPLNADASLGLYQKYDINWKANAPGEQSLCFCDMFIIDMEHDEYATVTLQKYLDITKLDHLPEQFYVIRRRNDLSNKHAECHFFVLNLTLDIHAVATLAFYASLCKDKYPALHYDLLEMVRRNTHG